MGFEETNLNVTKPRMMTQNVTTLNNLQVPD